MSETKLPSPRSGGILLHPTSLPGPFGIGDLGPAAYAWIDTLVYARQKWWQILPLGPTGYGDSPYQCFSAFAGSPYLVSPHLLLEDGLIAPSDMQAPGFPAERVDYGTIIPFKNRLLARAWQHFGAGQANALRDDFERFHLENSAWLDDYALFMALKEQQGGRSWLEWPDDLRRRQPAALDQARAELADAIGSQCFRQFLFFRQWGKVRRYAHERGIKIIGDLPIFVSGDSADVWANPHLFMLDAQRRPTHVAGVPPDYFSATGQLWGNPLYDWQAMAAEGYGWWIARMRSCLALVDLVRLDHFRGFHAYFEIPAGRTTAEVGRWVPGPAEDLLHALEKGLGGLPLIAEDLGVITPEVIALRDKFHLPGMRILQFAFDSGPDNRFLPHNYESPRTVVYTGTHDNDTTRGWYATAPEQERDYARRYMARDGHDIAWDLIRMAWSSVADYAIVPLQDMLNLDTSARMNYPGRPSGNWSWRYVPHQLNPWILDRLADLTNIYGR